jgi:hypothetical protein
VAKLDVAAVTVSDEGTPRRKNTREQNRQRSIEAERRLNNEYIAERNKPPPL